jgi:hypothetical protein
MRKILRGRDIGSISYAAKEATCRTQLSDFLAYAVFQKLSNPSPTRAQWTAPIIGNRPFIRKIVDRDFIKEIMKFALPAGAIKTAAEQGIDPSHAFAKYKTKADLRQALERERARRESPKQ